MSETFADTSYFIALLNPRDSCHAAARRLSPVPGRMVTTNWVLAETGNYLSPLSHRRIFVEFVRLLRTDPATVVLPADAATFDAGFNLYARRPDKEWSLVDCISFAVMTGR